MSVPTPACRSTPSRSEPPHGSRATSARRYPTASTISSLPSIRQSSSMSPTRSRERGYKGKDMPIVSFDLVDGADYIEITCSPKALGSGRWAALEIFSFPELDVIEKYVMDCVLKAGSQHCPPVVIGVGIGGSFDYCAKIAKLATLRHYGQHNPEPIIADMEQRLLQAVNK